MVSESQDRVDQLQQPPLSLLFVEDNPDDVQLCLRVLKKANREVRFDVAKTMEEFSERLRTTAYDAILADYSLGNWTGLDALHLLKKDGREIPLILVTGALGEERAVECIKLGMADFILKDRMERLPVAVSRAIHEHALREKKERAEQAMRESEEKFRTLAEELPAATFIEQGSSCSYVNAAAERITGYSRKELLEMNFWELVHPDSRKVIIDQAAKRLEGDRSAARYRIKILTRQSEAKWLDVTVGTFQLDRGLAALITAFEVVEQEDLEGLVGSDRLTGLGNYCRMLDVFDAETNRSTRTGRAFSVAVFDLDGLKHINERNGYIAGDRALCRFARMLLRCRALDTPVRIDGNRFALILPETGKEGAEVVGRRIVARLADDAEEPRLSCSFGIATYPVDGKTIDGLLNTADRKLRAMKTTGGGRLPLQAATA